MTTWAFQTSAAWAFWMHAVARGPEIVKQLAFLVECAGRRHIIRELEVLIRSDQPAQLGLDIVVGSADVADQKISIPIKIAQSKGARRSVLHSGRYVVIGEAIRTGHPSAAH